MVQPSNNNGASKGGVMVHRPHTTNKNEEVLDFKKMLDEVSRNFGFKDIAMGLVGSKSTLIPHPEGSKRGTYRKASMDEDPEEEMKNMDANGKGKSSVTDLMKDTHMVERYS